MQQVQRHGDADEVVLPNLQSMSFFKSVKNGTVIKLTGRVIDAGNTSFMVAMAVTDVISSEAAIGGYIISVTIDKDTEEKKQRNR